jgi:hypothetical protein
MPLPRPSRPITVTADNIADTTAAPLSQEGHRAEPTRYKPSDTFIFKAQTDITAYELAELLRVFFNGVMLHHEVFAKLDPSQQRHFIHRKIA